MTQDAVLSIGDSPEYSHQWSARKLRPIILLYVAAVFVVMMLLAFFLLHSVTAVKALATAAVGSLGALVPGIGSRVEYRLTDHVLEQRHVAPKKPKQFKTTFQLDELSHIVPMRHGFKFYKHLNEPNSVRRYLKSHFSDAFSGEVHVENADRERVLEILKLNGVPFR